MVCLDRNPGYFPVRVFDFDDHFLVDLLVGWWWLGVLVLEGHFPMYFHQALVLAEVEVKFCFVSGCVQQSL
jgi:hypothetical protein